MYIIHTLQHTYKYRCNTNTESQLFEASFVLVGKSACLVWSHCPTAWFPKLEDHRHTVLHMVVDVAMDDPCARVVQWCSDDDVAVRWDLYCIFENRLGDVTWQSFFLVLLDDEFSRDVLVKLTLADHVEPASMLMNWMSNFGVGVDEDDFKPFSDCLWLLEDVAAVCRPVWTWSLIFTHGLVADSSTTTGLV